ncbi:MAG TPA: hypothetical protein VH684_13460 [Xanthobacteraceae bacterium]|jgi:hypothetical protein
MRARALSVGSIGIGFAIVFWAAIPRVSLAGSEANEPPANFSSSEQAQFQKFAQWQDRHGALGETCLPQPDGAAVPGTRWHYHVDAATQRHCWYQKPVAAASGAPVPAAKKSRAQAADSGHSKKRARPAERTSPVPAASTERASRLPLTPAERETLFRRFQQWREDRASE